MSRALRLHERHSKAELIERLEGLKADPDAHQAGGLHLLTPKARDLMDDLLLAIYWHDRPQGNTHMSKAQPQTKWW